MGCGTSKEHSSTSYVDDGVEGRGPRHKDDDSAETLNELDKKKKKNDRLSSVSRSSSAAAKQRKAMGEGTSPPLASLYRWGRPTVEGGDVLPALCYSDCTDAIWMKGGGEGGDAARAQDVVLLYRIVLHRPPFEGWAFYNDTPDIQFHVTIRFFPDPDQRFEVLTPLGETRLVWLEKCEEGGGAVAKLVVGPTETALAVEGRMKYYRITIEGFHTDIMGCGASSDFGTVQFKNGKPSFKGDEIVKGFDEGNGLLFRIVNTKKRQWAYYNDTKEYEMHVKVTFSEDCDIKALGKTHLERQDSGEYLATVVVYPCETEMFIEGRVNGFRVKMDALPLSDEYRRRNENKK